MKKSIIFLDIDGGVNSVVYCKRMDVKYKNEQPLNPFVKEIDPELVSRVGRLATETDSDVVLSSTWKEIWVCPELGKDDFASILEENNVFIKDITPTTGKGRPYEIKKWLSEHPEVKYFVSLDDDYSESFYKNHGIGGHTIHTKYWCTEESEGGFQEKDYLKAKKILKIRRK